jgi:hypothetical protein
MARVWRAWSKLSRYAPVRFVINRDAASLSPFTTIYECKGHGSKDEYDYDAAESECIENHDSSPLTVTVITILVFANKISREVLE